MSNCDNAADVKSENALSRKKRFFFVFLMALVAFVFVEAGVRFASAILPRSGPQSVEDLSIYPDKKMAKELYREQDEIVGKIELPYSGWGDREFHGKYINVDHDAVRQTWNPNSTAAKRMNIFLFGGSTAWGWGARDEYTIPSYLSKQLNEGNTGRTNYHVRNYAETSYTFMQSAVRLFALLEAGERPNYVIFYGGYNELWSVYRTGIPGVAGDEKVFTEFYEERIYPNFWEDRLVAGVTALPKKYV